MRKNNSFAKRLFTLGTVECAVGCVLVGIFTVLLLLWAGIWQTLLVAAFITAGVFIGGVKNKKQFIRKLFGVSDDFS